MSSEIQPEQLLLRYHVPTEAWIMVAVDSTRRGPAVGGCRWWHYPRLAEARRDARELARAMTLKAAVAHLPHGGGKTVIYWPHQRPATPQERRSIWRMLAHMLNDLDGTYITAEDVGTSSTDMAVLAEFTPWVIGLPPEAGGLGDPGPFTAQGVHAGLQVCLQHLGLEPDQLRAGVIGLGQVGWALAELLLADGMQVQGYDLRSELQPELQAHGGSWAQPSAMAAECQLLLPCALGGSIDAGVLGHSQLRLVCGAANNPLAASDLAQALHQKGILYAPDYVVNAGGLMAVCAEWEMRQQGRNFSPQQITEAVRRQVAERTQATLERAARDGITPLAAAQALAAEALA